MEGDTLLDMLEAVAKVDFVLVWRAIIAMMAFLWGFVILWVWSDSGERTSNMWFRIAMVLFVAPFNIPGLIIYFLVRPSQTIEQVYWAEQERKYLIYETSDIDDCPKCGEQIMPGYNVCPRCAYEVKIQCEGCEVMIDRNFKYCPYCGFQHRQRAAAEEIVSQEEMEAKNVERKAEIVEEVETKGTRFVLTRGFGHKLTGKIGGAFLNLLDGFKNVKVTKKSVETAKEEEVDNKAVAKVVKNSIKQTSAKSKAKRKSKKKKK